MDNQLDKIACVFYYDLYAWGNSIKIIVFLMVILVVTNAISTYYKRQSAKVRDAVLFDLSRQNSELYKRVDTELQSVRYAAEKREKELLAMILELQKRIEQSK